MATATRNEGKTTFVEQVLRKNPYANVKTVNEAWTASGHEGSISPALVNKLRLEAGLSGNLRTKGKPQAEAISKEPALVGKKRIGKPKVKPRDQGKSSFVKEFLLDHSEGNVKAVNSAWQADGFEGTISPTLVNKTRSQLGLTGKRRSKTKLTEAASPKPYTGKKRGRKPKVTNTQTSPTRVETRGRKSVQTLGLIELEGEIDRLIFKLMGIGDLPEIEESLRNARRLLFAKLIQG